MRLRELSDRFFFFAIPVGIIGFIVGSFLWVLVSTYFWDTSRLTIILPNEEIANIHLTTQARLVYWDFSVFGFPYSVHFTLPWSAVQSCHTTCTIENIPAGDGALSVESSSGRKNLVVKILPATEGSIDLRPKITITDVSSDPDIQDLRAGDLTDTAASALPGTLVFRNPVQGVFLIQTETGLAFYDLTTEQLLPLPASLQSAERIGRGEHDGVYLLSWAALPLTSYDRYGREPVKSLDTLVSWPYTLNWKDGNTHIEKTEGTQDVTGIWWPLFTATQSAYLITDGQKISILQ